MSVADLKAHTQQIFDLFNTHDVQAASAYFAEDAELRDVAVARPVIGPQQIAAVYARQLDAIRLFFYANRLFFWLVRFGHYCWIDSRTSSSK